jgi:prepilin-type N-terminal cleavage/methylation domain-containing protein
MKSKLEELQLKKTKQEGFTIIEVLIVLAIAGLIILIVFLAVPALQRNSRNTQRKNDVAAMGGLISEYVSNNNGRLPTTITAGATPATPAANTLYLGNTTFSIMGNPGNPATLPATVPQPAADTMVIYTNANCNGNAAVPGNSTRAVVILYTVEGSGGDRSNQCNQV